jgi:hypothetical protein
MGEFTYSKVELKDRTTFQKERPLIGDIEIKPSRHPHPEALWEEGYTGHSFRKGAAQPTLDRRMTSNSLAGGPPTLWSYTTSTRRKI